MKYSYDIGYIGALVKLGMFELADAELEKTAGLDKEARANVLKWLTRVLGGRFGTAPSAKGMAQIEGTLAKGMKMGPSTWHMPTAAGKISPHAMTRGAEKAFGANAGAPMKKPADWLKRLFTRSPTTGPTAAAARKTPTGPGPRAAGEVDEAFAGRGMLPGEKDYAALEKGMLEGAEAGAGAKPWTLGRKLKWGLGLGAGGLGAAHFLGEKTEEGAPRQAYQSPYGLGYYER